RRLLQGERFVQASAEDVAHDRQRSGRDRRPRPARPTHRAAFVEIHGDELDARLPLATPNTHVELGFEPLRGGQLPVERRHGARSEEHTSELQSRENLVCRLLLEKKKNKISETTNN